MYYLSSEKKGADQLRLCFPICKKAGFLMTWLKMVGILVSGHSITGDHHTFFPALLQVHGESNERH